MKRKTSDYVVEARKANAQAEKNAAMGFILFVIGAVMLFSFIGSLVR
jgi:hypothetical protein